jgi:hypothetical protein
MTPAGSGERWPNAGANLAPTPRTSRKTKLRGVMAAVAHAPRLIGDEGAVPCLPPFSVPACKPSAGRGHLREASRTPLGDAHSISRAAESRRLERVTRGAQTACAICHRRLPRQSPNSPRARQYLPSPARRPLSPAPRAGSAGRSPRGARPRWGEGDRRRRRCRPCRAEPLPPCAGRACGGPRRLRYHR